MCSFIMQENASIIQLKQWLAFSIGWYGPWYDSLMGRSIDTCWKKKQQNVGKRKVYKIKKECLGS